MPSEDVADWWRCRSGVAVVDAVGGLMGMGPTALPLLAQVDNARVCAETSPRRAR